MAAGGPTPPDDQRKPDKKTTGRGPVPALSNLDEPLLYVNDELSLLQFQWRMAEGAFDERNPLAERAKFLGIFGSSLDELFMVRVAGPKQQVAAGALDVSRKERPRPSSSSWCARKR